MSNIVAGIGRGQMEVLDKHIALRRDMHQFYTNLFKEVPGITVFKEPSKHYHSNHWLSCITIDPAKTAMTPDRIRESLLAENIESRPLWKPMHLQPVFKESPYYGATVSEKLFNSGLCLPSGSNLTTNELDRISTCIKKKCKFDFHI